MTHRDVHQRRAPLPDRQLRLLANMAPAATALFGLLTVWLALTTLRNLAQPMSSVAIVSIVLGLGAAVLSGLTTYRLGIEVPRTLRGWQAALVERKRARHEE